jgi:hypothetical protein
MMRKVSCASTPPTIAAAGRARRGEQNRAVAHNLRNACRSMDTTHGGRHQLQLRRGGSYHMAFASVDVGKS